MLYIYILFSLFKKRASCKQGFCPVYAYIAQNGIQLIEAPLPSLIFLTLKLLSSLLWRQR